MITYTGRISFVRFYSEETKFIVASFECNEEGQNITITGSMSHVSKDETYRLTGDYVVHPRYGKQFKISSYEVVLATDKSEIVRYLSSSLFKGIGRKQAETIVNTLGDDALSKIKEDPSCLLAVKGMSQRKIDVIVNVLTTQDTDAKLLNFFMSNGLSTRFLPAIQDAYGDQSVKVMKKNPYQLIRDIDGIGFKTADDLATKMNFDLHSPYRIKAAILDALNTLCFRSGATYEPLDALERAFYKFLPDASQDVFEEQLQHLIEDHDIVLEEGRYYPADLYDSEVTIASLFKRFRKLPKTTYKEDELNQAIENIEKELSIHYDDIQKEAMIRFMNEPAMILTGGPGTGKTTIVTAIVKLYHSLHPEHVIDLAAPTGRAAKRLSELTNFEASTIHRLLKWDITKNTVGMNEDNPLSTQLLVIDEFSMVDTLVFAKLLKASRHVVKILMIGDDEQLPPVGCGAVLKDLMASKMVPTITLEHIYRQSEGSGIVKLAHAIRHHSYDASLIHSDDTHMISCFNYEVPTVVQELIKQAMDEGYTMDDIQVLAPMYNGVAGIDALNEAIQNAVNPHDPDVEELRVGRRTFRVGDKILQLKNRVDDNVFNGDIGTLVDIEREDKIMHTPDTLVVDFDDQEVEYDPDHFREITHAFCMSVHKSQGNEFPIVIMSVLPDYHIMMRKNLLYTGLTRAKRALYLVGDEMAFVHGLERDVDTNRATTLTMRLLKDHQKPSDFAFDHVRSETKEEMPAYTFDDIDDKLEF